MSGEVIVVLAIGDLKAIEDVRSELHAAESPTGNPYSIGRQHAVGLEIKLRHGVKGCLVDQRWTVTGD